MRRNLFAKLGLTFLALLAGALLAVAYFAEHTLRRDYQATADAELTAVAGIARARAAALPAWPPSTPEDPARLKDWVSQIAASGARVTVFASDGQVLAD